MPKKLLFKSGEDWNISLIKKIYDECEKIATKEMELTYYPNQLEIVSAEMMLDAYSSIGLPVNYNHWSFGKDFVKNWNQYKKGNMGLAYEMVINSNPCINYLMEENDATMQMLVIAHAAFGHNFVFKNNYMFKTFTNAEYIIDYMEFAKKYIASCEEKYGISEVEKLLDACHSLRDHGVDAYVRRSKKRLNEEERLMQEKIKYDKEIQYYDDVINKTIHGIEKNDSKTSKIDPKEIEPQENILYYIEKNAPNLKPWEREIIRIVRKISQYFYPQGSTKTLNEGFASFTHYYIVNRLYEKGLIDDGTMQSFLISHTNVIYQPEYWKPWYSGLNPYALGFAIFRDLKRICESPTEEDKKWFPNIIGQRWQDVVKDAASNYKDDSFIQQWLSPKVIRDFKLFEIEYDEKGDAFFVEEIHDEIGYERIRNHLSESYNRINYVPNIQIVGHDKIGDRTLYLKYFPFRGRPLNEDYTGKTLNYLKQLWGYEVKLDRG
jgi:spore cortex formation protein SpoVR/YcgB (stage V sporulation)